MNSARSSQLACAQQWAVKVKFKSQSYEQNFSLQFYLGKWNFILTYQILSQPVKAKFHFSGLFLLILLALFTILYSSGSYKRKHRVNFARFLHHLLRKFILTGKNRAHFTEIDYL